MTKHIKVKDEQKTIESPTVQFINHESRIARLEAINEMILSTLTRMDEKIDSNFKWTIGTILTMSLALAGLIYKK